MLNTCFPQKIYEIHPFPYCLHVIHLSVTIALNLVFMLSMTKAQLHVTVGIEYFSLERGELQSSPMVVTPSNAELN